MKRLGLIPLLCLFLLGSSIFSAADTRRYYRDCTLQLQSIVQASESGQWDIVRIRTDALMKNYTAYRRRAGWYASDSELHTIQDALYALEISAGTGDVHGLAAACAHTRAALQILVQGQAFTWDALL
ncbi:MAG: DUF4363 family protein [Clostridia bacterium]|nr:DUF4363 family protein [Clostridia bacterium]